MLVGIQSGVTEKTKKISDEELKLNQKERNSKGSVIDIYTKTKSNYS